MWTASWPHLELVTLILSMASPDLVTVVPIGTSPGPHVSGPTWASPSPGDVVPHLGLIAVDSFLASPGTGDSDTNWASP